MPISGTHVIAIISTDQTELPTGSWLLFPACAFAFAHIIQVIRGMGTGNWKRWECRDERYSIW